MSIGRDSATRERHEIGCKLPVRQIRAHFDERTVRVYQTYSAEIADIAMASQTFKSPFSRQRMTWIKPSFTWMMHRSGWGTKSGQERVLAIDILRDGFEWALANSCTSHFDSSVYSSVEEWRSILGQWDPERTITLEALPWRAIQVGLGGRAVNAYVDQWIVRINDVTSLAREIEKFVARHDLEQAMALRPVEKPYPLPKEIADGVGCTAVCEE